MADRLALKKWLSPELRQLDNYNRETHTMQVSDDIQSNYFNLSDKSTSIPVETLAFNKQFVAAGSGSTEIIFDSGSGFAKFGAKTLIISADGVVQVEIKREDEAGGLGAGAAIIDVDMVAGEKLVIPFGFGDKIQAGRDPVDNKVYRLVATLTGAGTAKITASGPAVLPAA